MGDRVAKSEAAAGSFAGLPDQDAPPQLRRPCAGGLAAGVAEAGGKLLRERGVASALQRGWRGAPRDQAAVLVARASWSA
jgi:hypothetical protein